MDLKKKKNKSENMAKNVRMTYPKPIDILVATLANKFL